MFGLFTNVLPIRLAWTETQSFVDFQAQLETLKCNEYAYYSFVDIQKQSELKTELTDHLWVLKTIQLIQQSFLQMKTDILLSRITKLLMSHM